MLLILIHPDAVLADSGITPEMNSNVNDQDDSDSSSELSSHMGAGGDINDDPVDIYNCMIDSTRYTMALLTKFMLLRIPHTQPSAC